MKAFYALFLPERVSDPAWILALTRRKVQQALETSPRMAPCPSGSHVAMTGLATRVLGYMSSDLVTKHVVRPKQ